MNINGNQFPPEFFDRLGRYVAICGHIEGVAWRILVKHKDPVTLKLDHKLISARKSHSKLISNLEKAAGDMPDELGRRLAALLDRIDNEIVVRHMAIHGMWIPTSNPYEYKVEYFRNVSEDRSSPDWQQYDQPISLKTIEENIEGAQEILSELLSIFSAIGDD